MSFRSPPATISRALGDRPIELILEGLGSRRRRQRSDLGALGGRVPGLGGRHRGRELLEEIVVELVGDDEPLRRVAGLAGVVEAGADRGLDRFVEVLGSEQDERIGAAELEHDLLQVAPGDLGDRGAGPLGAGQRDASDSRIGDHLGDLLVRGRGSSGTRRRGSRRPSYIV